MKVFVTGSRGYLGSLVVESLRNSDCYVIGCDIGIARLAEWNDLVAPNEAIGTDFRLLNEEYFARCDYLIHLAAIPNETCAEIQGMKVFEINTKAAIEIAKKAKLAGVKRFIFASSCSVYENSSGFIMNERYPIIPKSLYAISKYKAELGLKKLADKYFNVACLRFATAYGVSPSLRLDLVLNAMTVSSFLDKKIYVYGNPHRYRPFCSAKQISGFISYIAQKKSWPNNYLCLNVGSNRQNYSLSRAAKIVNEVFPESKIIYCKNSNTDTRNYTVDFSLLASSFPSFVIKEDMPDEVRILSDRFKKYGSTKLIQNLHNFNRKYSYSFFVTSLQKTADK